MKLRLIILLSLIGFFSLAINAEQPVASTAATLKYPVAGFTWGADIGSSIDMSNNGMSSIDADAYFGYKNSIIRTIGVGASYHTSLGNNNTLIPIYVIFRSSFTQSPSLCFLDLRGGYSFNTLDSKFDQNGIFASAGVGFNLYCSQKFKSHIILAYSFTELKPYTKDEKEISPGNLHSMSVRIGISF